MVNYKTKTKTKTKTMTEEKFQRLSKIESYCAEVTVPLSCRRQVDLQRSQHAGAERLK